MQHIPRLRRLAIRDSVVLERNDSHDNGYYAEWLDRVEVRVEEAFHIDSL